VKYLLGLLIVLLLVGQAWAISTPDRDTLKVYDDGTVRYDYSFKVSGRDTAQFGPFMVQNYRSYSVYLWTTDTTTGDIDVALVALQSDIQDSLFSRVDLYSAIDTSVTDSATGHWYDVPVIALRYIKYYVYGNSDNQSTPDTTLVRLRLVFAKWKGTQKTLPAGGIYANFPSYFWRPVSFSDSLSFWGWSSDWPRLLKPYLAWSPHGRTLMPIVNAGVSLGDASHYYQHQYTSNLTMNSGATLTGAGTGVISSNATIRPITNKSDPLGSSSYWWKALWTASVRADSGVFDSVLTVPRRAAPFIPATAGDIMFESDEYQLRYYPGGVRWHYILDDSTDQLVGGQKSFNAPLQVRTSTKSAVVCSTAYAGLKIQNNQYAFCADADTTAGIRFHVSGATGIFQFLGDGADARLYIQATGSNKGDVLFFDNAATPATKLQWDASKTRLVPGADHGTDLGTAANAFDTMYAADFNVTSEMFTGDGEQAFCILNTVQPTADGRVDYEAIDPYMNPNGEATSMNRWLAVLTTAVIDLKKKTDEQAKLIAELSK
jgi:hypothetical protein